MHSNNSAKIEEDLFEDDQTGVADVKFLYGIARSDAMKLVDMFRDGEIKSAASGHLYPRV